MLVCLRSNASLCPHGAIIPDYVTRKFHTEIFVRILLGSFIAVGFGLLVASSWRMPSVPIELIPAQKSGPVIRGDINVELCSRPKSQLSAIDRIPRPLRKIL